VSGCGQRGAGHGQVGPVLPEGFAQDHHGAGIAEAEQDGQQPIDQGAVEEPVDVETERGWTDALTVSALAAVAFARWELRAAEPMLDPRLFRLRGFSAGSLTITAQFFAAFGFFFTALQYLQYRDRLRGGLRGAVGHLRGMAAPSQFA
jgi:hypothetical protein